MKQVMPLSSVSIGPQKSERVPEIDGLRGLAIISVIFWHFFAGAVPTEPGTLPAYLLLPLSLTHTGVQLFFVLSGFLIGGILLDAKHSETYFKTFYVRRALRILPLYWILTTAYVIAATTFSLPFMFNDAAPAPIYFALLQDIWISRPGHGVVNGLATHGRLPSRSSSISCSRSQSAFFPAASSSTCWWRLSC